MQKKELEGGAKQILNIELAKSTGLIIISLLYFMLEISFVMEGFVLLALFALIIPVFMWRRHARKKRLRLRIYLEEQCRVASMKQVYAYLLSREEKWTGKRKRDTAREAKRGLIRSEIYLGQADFGESDTWRVALGEVQGRYEQLFLAFVKEDREAFKKLLPPYLAYGQSRFHDAGRTKKARKEYFRYHNSLRKLDVYQAFMEGNIEEFARQQEEQGLFTTAEKVILMAKKACVLEAYDRKNAAAAWYYVLSAGNEMQLATQAKEHLKELTAPAKNTV